MGANPPPQTHAPGRRRALDEAWLAYLRSAPFDPSSLTAPPGLAEGVRLFNEGRYLDAHEAWETAWRETPYPGKLLLLALAKIAAGLAHRGGAGAASRVTADGLRFLAPFEPACMGVDIASLRVALAGGAAPPPRIAYGAGFSRE
ncbi:MAG: DUF309 domain-containing protein [Chloroflexota bacterium]|nr:DUF309 domain-containing protein [Chloroflexota bacterium]